MYHTKNHVNIIRFVATALRPRASPIRGAPPIFLYATRGPKSGSVAAFGSELVLPIPIPKIWVIYHLHVIINVMYAALGP